MAKKLTKYEAHHLLNAYAAAQNAATDREIAAYDAQQDAALKQKEEETAAALKKKRQEADAAYDKQEVQRLVAKRTIRQKLSDWGLLNSGAAVAGERGADRAAAVSRAATAKAYTTAVADARRTLQQAAIATGKRKDNHDAQMRKTLTGKIEEKRLTLNKSAE